MDHHGAGVLAPGRSKKTGTKETWRSKLESIYSFERSSSSRQRKPGRTTANKHKPKGSQMCCWRLAPEPEETRLKDDGVDDHNPVVRSGSRVGIVLEAEVMGHEIDLTRQVSCRGVKPLCSALKSHRKVSGLSNNSDTFSLVEAQVQVTTPSTDASPIADVALDAEASSSAEDLAPKGEQTPVSSQVTSVRDGVCGGCFKGLFARQPRSSSKVVVDEFTILPLSDASAPTRTELAAAYRQLPQPSAPTSTAPVLREDITEDGFFLGLCKSLEDIRVVKRYMEEAVRCYDMTLSPWQDLSPGVKVARAHYMQPIDQNIPGWLRRLAGMPSVARATSIFQLGHDSEANEVTMVHSTSIPDLMYGDRFRVRATMTFKLDPDGITTHVQVFGEVIWIENLPLALAPVKRVVEQTVRSELRRVAPGGAKFMRDAGLTAQNIEVCVSEA
mmetsp:Transcript_40732/g.93725  ORF Transcript_40732/g.93725 Transcript_40732/m.93725 type:complete len:443 (+) Transcript_40732:81-1409(+)